MVKDDKEDEPTNPGREVNGSDEHEDLSRTYFQAHVRKAARASIPETPEEMLPWLVGRMAANEVKQQNFEAFVEAKIDALTEASRRATRAAEKAAEASARAAETSAQAVAVSTEIARRAPTVREKYTFATGLLVIAIGLVAKYLGIDPGPLLGP